MSNLNEQKIVGEKFEELSLDDMALIQGAGDVAAEGINWTLIAKFLIDTIIVSC